MHRLHPILALVAFVALPMALAADTPPPQASNAMRGDSRMLHVRRIEHANARELDIELNKIFAVGPPSPTGPLVVVSDLDTNSLILSGSPGLLSEAESILQKLDAAATGSSETQIIRLKHAHSKELARILREIVGHQLQTSRSGWVGIAFDERTESLILTGRPAALGALRTLIDGLDIESRRPVE